MARSDDLSLGGRVAAYHPLKLTARTWNTGVSWFRFKFCLLEVTSRQVLGFSRNMFHPHGKKKGVLIHISIIGPTSEPTHRIFEGSGPFTLRFWSSLLTQPTAWGMPWRRSWMDDQDKWYLGGRESWEGKGGETKASTWANKNISRRDLNHEIYGCLKVGILIRVYHNPPHNWVVCHPLCTPNQGFFIVHMVGLGVRGCWVDRKRCWEKLLGWLHPWLFGRKGRQKGLKDCQVDEEHVEHLLCEEVLEGLRLLMEEFLHQLIGSFTPLFCRVLYTRGGAGFLPSTGCPIFVEPPFQ